MAVSRNGHEPSGDQTPKGISAAFLVTRGSQEGSWGVSGKYWCVSTGSCLCPWCTSDIGKDESGAMKKVALKKKC